MNTRIDKEKQKRIIYFLLIAVGIVTAYYLVVMFWSKELFEPYIGFTAYLSALILKIFDGTAASQGSVVATKSVNMVLSFGCDGSEAIIIYLAGVLAFPAIWSYKLKGAAIGALLIYCLNLLRVAILYFVVLVNPSWFESFHTEILPILFIMISLSFWYIWLKNLKVA